MNDKDFQKLVESVNLMGSIIRGKNIPHRRTVLAKVDVKGLRERLSLTQSQFAGMIGVNIKTLQNWEQGRREPEGPAKALLLVVKREPTGCFERAPGIKPRGTTRARATPTSRPVTMILLSYNPNPLIATGWCQLGGIHNSWGKSA